MSPTHFQDDLAEWDLCTGKGLVNDLESASIFRDA